MTLKTARKLIVDTKVYYSAEVADGEFDYCIMNYLGDQKEFTESLNKVSEWERRKAIVKNIGYNKAHGCIEVDIKIN